MRRLAEEEGIDLNGSLLEDLFWNEYTGTDEAYTFLMKNLYEGSRNLKQTMTGVLETMAYSEGHMVKDNVEFMKIVRDCIGSSDWCENDANYTDFRIDNRWRFVDTLADIFCILADELERRKSFVGTALIMRDVKPWDTSLLPVTDKRREAFLTDEANYENDAVEAFRFRGQSLKKTFEDNVTPGRVIDLIIENWDFFWNYSCTYEATEYCVTLSNISDRPLFRKRMRKFFREESERQRMVNITVEAVAKDENAALSQII